MSYDSITFNSYLETIIASNSTSNGGPKQNQSPWLFLDAANVLFSVAKKRAYINEPKASGSSTRASSTAPSEPESIHVDAEEDDWEALREAEAGPSGAPTSGINNNGFTRTRTYSARKGKWPEGVEPVLEELPKWGLLAQVLEEVEGEIAYGAVKDQGESSK